MQVDRKLWENTLKRRIFGHKNSRIKGITQIFMSFTYFNDSIEIIIIYWITVIVNYHIGCMN